MQGKRLNKLNIELQTLKSFPEFSTKVDENDPRIRYISFKGVENFQFTFSNEYVRHFL